MAGSTKERRGFTRIPFHTDVEILAGDQIHCSSNGIDISMSGLRITAKGTLPAEGAPCIAKITLKASDNWILIEAKGSVIRSEPGDLAVRFTELDIDSYQHLKQLILNNTDEPELAEQEFAAHWGIRPAGGSYTS